MKPQECEGTYRFDGKMYATRGVADLLKFDEFREILFTIHLHVQLHNGSDYLFVFQNEYLNKKIFVIDNLNDHMKKNADPQYVRDYNYFTIMFAEEY